MVLVCTSGSFWQTFGIAQTFSVTIKVAVPAGLVATSGNRTGSDRDGNDSRSGRGSGEKAFVSHGYDTVSAGGN